MPGPDNDVMKHFESGSNTAVAGAQNISSVNNNEIPSNQVCQEYFKLLVGNLQSFNFCISHLATNIGREISVCVFAS